MSDEPPPEPDEAPAPPPNEAERIGPESRKTVERIPLMPPAALSPLELSPLPSSSVDAEPPPDEPPDKLPSAPLLKDPNFCVIAEIFGDMMPAMSSWKLPIGFGASIPSCLFFSMLPLSN